MSLNPCHRKHIILKSALIRLCQAFCFLAFYIVNCRYMRGRLTLEKVNAAIGDMAMYAEANAQLISAPRNKVHV